MVSSIRRGGRRGFTLVELLVVILIIAVLIGLILPAIQGVKVKAAIARAHNDISQLSNAIGSFKTQFHAGYVPDVIDPVTNAASLANANSEIAKLWPRWNASLSPLFQATTPPGTALVGSRLEGSQCLVFFLGGLVRENYPTAPQDKYFQGFTSTNAAPFFDPPAGTTAPFSGKRTGPWFDYPVDRVTGAGGPHASGHFVDPWGTPYAYFTSRFGNDYGFALTSFTARDGDGVAFTVAPYRDSSGKFVNQSSFQIISAGPNQRFGPGGNWVPGAGAYATANTDGGDDLANFNGDKQLGAP